MHGERRHGVERLCFGVVFRAGADCRCSAEAAAAMRAASRARRAASRSGNSEASGTGSALARRDGVAHTKKSRPVHETMRASAESRTNWAALSCAAAVAAASCFAPSTCRLFVYQDGSEASVSSLAAGHGNTDN